MWKAVLAGTTALAIAGTTLVYAQPRDGGRDDGRRGAQERHRPSPEDMAAFTDARIAALKAGLKLTAAQEQNWPAFEQALRDFAKLRQERRLARRERREERRSLDPVDRLQRRAEALAGSAGALKKLADSAAPLYRSLDDAQKHRFIVLARMMRPRHAGHEHWRRFANRDRGGDNGERGMR